LYSCIERKIDRQRKK
jgi:hypothetical protein